MTTSLVMPPVMFPLTNGIVVTPGCRSASCSKLRPFSGSASSCCRLTMLDTVLVVVSTRGAAPSTVTFSETFPMLIVMFTTASIATVSTTPDRTRFWNPGSCAVIS